MDLSLKKQHEDEWPIHDITPLPEAHDEEEIRPNISLLILNNDFINIKRFSS